MAFKWGKVLAAVVTPMKPDGAVDFELAARLCRDIVDNGCDGVVVSGTTGEAATLTQGEKTELFARVKEAVGQRGMVIAGVGSNCTRDTVELLRRAEETPVDGYMVITPYYNKPNLSGLIKHFSAVNAASSRPIMLYNVPSRTGLDLTLESYREILARCPRITAVKEAGTDLEKAGQLAGEFAGVDFFSGNDSLTLPLLALGFKGVVSVAANVVPGSVARLVQLAAAGQWEEARALHCRLLPLFKALFVETNPVPVKAALVAQGWPVGETRLPLGSISPEHRVMVENLVGKYTREGR
ncbi:MAG TPA: 4-hydroxy-tetrahydrodipicolinate synthase [Bacillota bacterium]|nr:4-hydroxy-tetrahydrodipicolinate synthase [Bacillota bacterium]HPZ90091.1 4-hydroxy-tetrahydrodipicolinate synthase [Bacillota bacterium]HQE01037.1 4-hydroxy-tetrahydrodipicolinate synthase [Bacillota bacterium]